jgi:hypothetical protein
MMYLPRTKRIGITILLIGIVMSVFLYVTYAHTNDRICIAQKGSLDKALAISDADFLRSVAEVKGKAIEALKGQFNEENGLFTYLSHPNGDLSTRNNAIRQLLASRAIAVHSKQDASFEAMHRTNVEAVLALWYTEDEDRAYVYAFDKSKLGANAMLLRTLVASPFYNEYEEEARKLANGIVHLMNADGSFNPWYVEPGYEYDANYLLTFYSGEALVALLEYNTLANDDDLHRQIVKAADFYVQQYVTNIDVNYYPAYVPWHTLALNLLYKRTEDTRYADALFVLSDKLLEIQDRENFIGRFYNPETPEYGSPHVSSDAVYTEGFAYAYEIGIEVGDLEREKQYKEAIMLGFDNIKRLQFTSAWWNFFEDQETSQNISGGFRTHACKSSVRIDSIAHAIDGFTQIEAVFKP